MSRRALFVIDTQSDFNDPQGSLTSYERSNAKMERIATRIAEVQQEGGFVVVTLDTHPPIHNPAHLAEYRAMLEATLGADRTEVYMVQAEAIYKEELQQYPPHCEYGTAGWALTAVVGEALDQLGEQAILIQKPSYRLVDGYVMQGPADLIGKSGTEILAYLKAKGVEEIEVTGLITPVCVLAASESAVQSGFTARVEEAAVDSYDEASHQAGLEQIRAVGATVIPS